MLCVFDVFKESEAAVRTCMQSLAVALSGLHPARQRAAVHPARRRPWRERFVLLRALRVQTPLVPIYESSYFSRFDPKSLFFSSEYRTLARVRDALTVSVPTRLSAHPARETLWAAPYILNTQMVELCMPCIYPVCPNKEIYNLLCFYC